MINPDITYNQVYYVESPNQRSPVAIRPHLQNDRVEWEDTSRGSYAEVDKIRFTPSPEDDPEVVPEKIEIVTPDGEHITLHKLTVKLYNKMVREFVAGKPEFATDDELQSYYLNTNFHTY